MKATLRDLAITRDGDYLLTLSTRHNIGELYDELCGNDIDFTIKKYSAKRGVSANGLYWSSLTKLARKLGVTNACMHNLLLRRYGQPETVGDEVVYLMLPDTEEAENKALAAETYHIKPTSHTKEGKDGNYRAYILMRGSSTYNSEEFSRLLDGLLSECEEMGIRIITGRGD